MIEIDNQALYNAHIDAHRDKGYIPPYHGKKTNDYIFRDSTGIIVKTYNTDDNLDSILTTLKPIGFVNMQSHASRYWDTYYEQGQLSGYYNVYQNKKQGVIDSLGNIVIPIMYNYIQHKPNSFLVHTDSAMAVVVLNNIDRNLDFYDKYHERKPLIYLVRNDTFLQIYNYYESSFIDISHYEDIRWIGQGYEGLSWIKQNGLWGIRNFKNDSELMPSIYESGHYFSYFYTPEYRMVVSVSQNGKTGLLSLENDQVMEILPCIYDKIRASRNEQGPPYGYKTGYITVELNGKKHEYEINKLPLTKPKTN